MEGVTCNQADGALYAFPRIRLSNKAKKAAEAKGVPADEFYCLEVRADIAGELRCVTFGSLWRWCRVLRVVCGFSRVLRLLTCRPFR